MLCEALVSPSATPLDHGPQPWEAARRVRRRATHFRENGQEGLAPSLRPRVREGKKPDLVSVAMIAAQICINLSRQVLADMELFSRGVRAFSGP